MGAVTAAVAASNARIVRFMPCLLCRFCRSVLLLCRSRGPQLWEFADRQIEGAPHLAAVAAALMRRHFFQGGEDPLLHVVAPMNGQGSQHLGQDGVVGASPFALVGLA